VDNFKWIFFIFQRFTTPEVCILLNFLYQIDIDIEIGIVFRKSQNYFNTLSNLM